MTDPVFPAWLHLLASASLGLGVLCALAIIVDLVQRPQAMWIMNIVWPVTALFGSVLWLGFYWRFGRERRHSPDMASRQEQTPMAVAVAKGASHCGAGCAVGDLVAETIAYVFPAVAVAFGWRSLFSEKMFAIWILDFVVAFGLGVAFQYFTIQPMRHLAPAEGLAAAVKADIASITAWQVGMYGFMAVAQFLWFAPHYGGAARPDMPEFWFAMQIAMLCGFCTAFPANWILIKAGLKEKM